jgi:biotin operon repressor
MENRDFKGIWIPKEIYLSKELNWTDKIILLEIDSLDNDEHCFASNEYFAEFLGISIVSVSKSINKLKELGYIEQVSFNGRERRLKSNFKADLNQTLRQTKRELKVCIKENFKHNNIDNKLTNKKDIYISQFNEFWSIYMPVKCNGRFVDKGSKKTAFEKFIKILEKGENYEDIIRGTKEYINHCRANNQLTCGATVFLNQERWKCDYSATINSNTNTEHGQPRSILETYAQIARKYK